MSKRPYFFNLDGLRGFAILMVLLHHCPLNLPFLDVLTENGRYGVDLFFCISGFLICALFLNERQNTGRIRLKRFYGRRVARLFPLYYATLALYCVLIFGVGLFSPENQQIFKDKLPSYIFYYCNILTIGAVGPFFFAWSLAVEEQFYSVFGALMRFVTTPVILTILCFSILMKVWYYNGFLTGFELSQQWEYIVFSYREPILLGVLLAYFVNTPRGLQFFQRYLCHPPVVIFLTVVWFLFLYIHPLHHRSTWDAQLFYLLTTLLIGSAALSQPAPFISNQALSHFGKISYGVYLFHMLFINTLFKLTDNPIIVLATTVLLCFVVNTFIYKYFEAPLMKLGNRKLASGST